MMEQSIEKLNFEDVDQMIQVHDYQGVSLTNRDANSKNAASEATSIFQNHYPEFLVSFHVLALFPCDPSQLTRAGFSGSSSLLYQPRRLQR